ncbi:MAG: 23S rRNA (pseudouridine(1915)-N(3))-methyltransferase RlmH [Burkholderiales bacterium]|jgi:23S rRNA (pseudouridine1915-N3)-methyltransferase|nr:23S rRNA (pseudouridine(1915)-N(3))-methyltransferase RlmH [Burkholderiales bacterium]
MKLAIVALGHRMPAWVAAGYDDYASRLPRDWPLDLVELKPEARDRGRSVGQLLETEAKRLDAACAGAAVVALDEQGSAWSTRELADRLARWRESVRSLAFVIGSADGLDAGFKRRAAARLSISALTLPHALVRVVLAEQLYRAASLLGGHPYHRE